MSLTISVVSITDNSISVDCTYVNTDAANSHIEFLKNGVIDGTVSIGPVFGTITYTYNSLIPNTTYSLRARLLPSFVSTDPISPRTTCYLENTLILCSNNEYKKISNLVIGEMIKTTIGDKKIKGIQKILYDVNDSNPTHKIYKLSKLVEPNLIEDLYITGGHSILVDELKPEEIVEMKKYYGENLEKIENKYKLLACVDKRFEQIDMDKQIFLYHILLENNDVEEQFIIYANGILSESISEKFYKMNSNL